MSTESSATSSSSSSSNNELVVPDKNGQSEEDAVHNETETTTGDLDEQTDPCLDGKITKCRKMLEKRKRRKSRKLKSLYTSSCGSLDVEDEEDEEQLERLEEEKRLREEERARKKAEDEALRAKYGEIWKKRVNRDRAMASGRLKICSDLSAEPEIPIYHNKTSCLRKEKRMKSCGYNQCNEFAGKNRMRMTRSLEEIKEESEKFKQQQPQKKNVSLEVKADKMVRMMQRRPTYDHKNILRTIEGKKPEGRFTINWRKMPNHDVRVNKTYLMRENGETGPSRHLMRGITQLHIRDHEVRQTTVGKKRPR